VLNDDEFAELAASAIATGMPLDLRDGVRVELHRRYKMARADVLQVVGGSFVGWGHSIFEVGGNPRGLLDLSGCKLQHLPQGHSAQQKLGAAVFVRAKGRLSMVDCEVASEAGFGLWLVQKASASLVGCRVGPCGRSSVCVFEDSRFEMEGSGIYGAMPHGICARGNATVTVTRSEIDGAQTRAVYCYHSATLELSETRISNTRFGTAAAVQVDSLRPQDAASVSLVDCVFFGNAGGDLSVTGERVRAVVTGSFPVCRVADNFANFSDRERDPDYSSRVV